MDSGWLRVGKKKLNPKKKPPKNNNKIKGFSILLTL